MKYVVTKLFMYKDKINCGNKSYPIVQLSIVGIYSDENKAKEVQDKLKEDIKMEAENNVDIPYVYVSVEVSEVEEC